MNLNIVSERLLLANKLSYYDLFSILDQLTDQHLDYGDIYFQSSYNESWILENKIIKNGHYNINQGVGVRVVSNEKTGFAYTNQINLKAIEESASTARTIIRSNNHNCAKKLKEIECPSAYVVDNPLQSMSSKDKLDILHHADSIARKEDRRVKEVSVNLNGTHELILIAATDGTLAADIRPLVHFSINVLVEDNNKSECGSMGGGGRFDYNWFLEETNGDKRIDSWAKEAVRLALINLSASAAPAGTFQVVLGSGWPGILLHEAVGHGLESEFNRRGTSVFSGQIGNLVASKFCTVVDDGTIPGYRGSISIDDEGTPGQRNVLIENGILKGYMQDKVNARLMNLLPTGNGRRQSYAHLPMPRMTNTYMLSGEFTPQEIIESVDYGIYASNFSGGQVDITSGNFVFSTSEAYLINNGKLSKPLKGVMLIGSGIEVMQQISMVGNDLKFDNGVGICEKEGQRLPVGVGQPTLKIDSLTVGGTE